MASTHDMQAAQKTYGGFITLIKWSIPAIAAITLLVLILISN